MIVLSNGFAHIWCEAITWTNVDLLIAYLGTNKKEITLTNIDLLPSASLGKNSNEIRLKIKTS